MGKKEMLLLSTSDEKEILEILSKDKFISSDETKKK
jgi:hypothetical protein